MRTWIWALGATLSLAILGCEDMGQPIEAADTSLPVWEGDIGPLVTAQCGSCHTLPPAAGVPPTFRLDKYAREDTPDLLPGAYDIRARLRARVVLQRSMPPDAPLSPAQRDRIDRWVQAGAPRDTTLH